MSELPQLPDNPTADDIAELKELYERDIDQRKSEHDFQVRNRAIELASTVRHEDVPNLIRDAAQVHAYLTTGAIPENISS